MHLSNEKLICRYNENKNSRRRVLKMQGKLILKTKKLLLVNSGPFIIRTIIN